MKNKMHKTIQFIKSKMPFMPLEILNATGAEEELKEIKKDIERAIKSRTSKKKQPVINDEEIKRGKLVRFIKSNNAFYAFTNFDGYDMEQLQKIKKDMEQEIRLTAEKNKQRKKKK